MIESLKKYEEAFVTIGNFDGLHLGHMKIIEAMKKDAGGKPVIAVTFEESTAIAVDPVKFKGYLFPPGFKMKVLSLSGVSDIISLDFKSVADIAAGDFIKLFLDRIGKLHIYAGPDFRFGRGNLGSIHTLRESAGPRMMLTVIEKLKKGISAVSSSLIRDRILEGELEEAAAMLGRPYFITSKKIKGDGIGRKTGYPTINLGMNRQILPHPGVYFTLFYFGGSLYPSMTYIGRRPTLDKQEMRNETNIIEFGGDFGVFKDGKDYSVMYIKKIRNEKKFHNLDDLEKTIYNDKSSVLELYSEYKASGKLPGTAIFV
ncbi:MAG: riboflavin kinase [Brevinematales bacterium]|jgi:riboflavin kinase/FMN adenylyltransferase